MHALEKILAKAAGVQQVRQGEIVNCRVDIAGINDLYLQSVLNFREMNGKKIANPDGVVVFLDHYAPASTVAQAENQKQFRAFCREQGIAKRMDVNCGVCHQVLVDEGLTQPGKVIVVTDSHTTTHGAFGAFSTGVGATDIAIILKTGKLWFKAPEIINIQLTGAPGAGVYAKDIILHIIGDLKADYAIYKAIEFSGPALKQMPVSERMVLCNMTTEMGAKAAYIQPDEATESYLKRIGAGCGEVFFTDADFQYAKELTYDVSAIRPSLAVPFSVDNVEELDNYIGTPVDQAYLGSCTGGRLEDIAVAAEILKGKKTAPETRFLVVPASRQVLLAAMEKGYVQILVEAGATFVTPGCASCLGTHQGILAADEVCISATNRNFPGRMGHRSGKIFLASPASVAAAALEGKIADPRAYLE